MKKSRCAYKAGDRRCNRNGFGNPPLCRPHALQLSLSGTRSEIDENSEIFSWIEAADRALSRSNNDLIQQVRGLFGEFLTTSANKKRTPSPKETIPPPIDDPRVILGFEPTESLTKKDVKDRKRALAALFHPDRPGGSVSAMKRVNEAADRLLASLP